MKIRWRISMHTLKWGWVITGLSLLFVSLNGLYTQKERCMEKTPLPTINVWIHGTLFELRHIIPKFLHIEQGLNPISSYFPEHYYWKIAQDLAENNPNRFNFDEFYLFGWSGTLSFAEREKAAKNLYDALKKLSLAYQQKYGQKPLIRLITHSHGGNVALNLAKIKDSNEITISELVLLACPVQKKTATAIADPMFKKVTSLISKIDMIQILDPQGLYYKEWPEILKNKELLKSLFSEREFQPQSNLIQAQIKLNNRSIFHMEFILAKFLKKLPLILNKIDKLASDQNSSIHKLDL